MEESSKVWVKEQWALSGSQVLQRLVALLLQVTSERQSIREMRLRKEGPSHGPGILLVYPYPPPLVLWEHLPYL